MRELGGQAFVVEAGAGDELVWAEVGGDGVVGETEAIYESICSVCVVRANNDAGGHSVVAVLGCYGAEEGEKAKNNAAWKTK